MPMTVQIVREPHTALADYARVPIAFDVRRIMDVAKGACHGEFVLSERALPTSTLKDYDALPHESPVGWRKRFSMSTWALFAAYADGARAGGAAVVMNSSEIALLEGRSDLALLWDIRVAPPLRRCGIGRALLDAVESWALERGAKWMKVETQDINVPACRFYTRHGFQLHAVNPRAYPDLPDETQLLWYKSVGA